jgi:hypothetical protein
LILENNCPATELFPRVGFQITTEENSTDDLPRNERTELNPIDSTFVCFRRNTTQQLRRESPPSSTAKQTLLPALLGQTA